MHKHASHASSGKKPSILILSASVGAGHMRAAQAIEKVLKAKLPQADIVHQDILEEANPVFRKTYNDGYFSMVKKAPWLVASLYDKSDEPHHEKILSKLVHKIERTNFRKLITSLTRKPPQWDLVINTHFLPAEIVAALRREKRCNIPQATVVTDFDVHGFWVQRPCEAYFVSGPQAKATLTSSGIAPARIHATGIPVDQAFTQPKDRTSCRKQHGFDPDRPLILQMAGGRGIGDIEKIYKSLLKIEKPVQICVVTGRNEEARKKLESIQNTSPHTCRIMGFTNQVDELMAAADMVVTKPGGLTSSEALARGCPIAIVNPIPGQETHNSDHLLEHGCGIKINRLETLAFKVEELLDDPQRLKRMQANALKQGKPQAAAAIADQCIRLLQSHTKDVAPEKSPRKRNKGRIWEPEDIYPGRS